MLAEIAEIMEITDEMQLFRSLLGFCATLGCDCLCWVGRGGELGCELEVPCVVGDALRSR